MKVRPLPPKDIQPPPPWALQHYLATAGRLGEKGSNLLSAEDIAASAPTVSAGKQLAHLWVKHNLALRLEQGKYALVDPSVAIRAWAISPYYAEVLTLTDALTRAGIPHAFACLTAGRDADYVPARAFVVVRSRDAPVGRIEHFTYKYAARGVTKFRLDVLGQRFLVPALTRDHAAIILASTSLPREVQAAKQLAHETKIQPWLAKRLNALGIRTDKSVYESEDPGVMLPPFIEDRRRKLADESLKEALA